MNRNTLYQTSSTELTLAKGYQSQVSRKEFEIQLLDIDIQYSSYNGNNSNFKKIQRQNIESEIINLKEYRNTHIYNAIDYALQLAGIEIRDNVVFSMASIAINSINSFLTIYQPEVIFLPQNLRERLTTIYNNLFYSSVNSVLHTEIAKLKNSGRIV